jgi:predicted acyltransferase
MTARLTSLDAFRGFTIAAMMLVNNPGDGEHTYAPLEHADWNGWTFTDLVFPFFLWIAGVAMTLSFARRVEQGGKRRDLFLHTLRRAALIFLIGFLLNLIPRFDFAHVRIPGVLQRIAICYLLAALIFLLTGLRGQIIAAGCLLAGYWMLMTLVPVPGYGPGILEKQGNFAQYIDGMVLSGHMWVSTKTWDPEGIVSTLPAIATVLFGIFAGHILRARQTAAEKTAWLFTLGAALLLAGAVLSPLLPINKGLWTSTYSLFMAGMASTAFAVCYWLIDVQGWKRWARPLVIYGMNPIVVFAGAGLLGKTLAMTGAGRAIFRTVYQPFPDPYIASLLYALTIVALFFGLSWFLYKRNWIVRL